MDYSYVGVSAQGVWAIIGAWLLWDWMTLPALAGLCWLWAARRDFRRRFLLAGLALAVLVVNPWTHDRLAQERYWRLLWLLPRGILIAMAAMDILRRIRPVWGRCLALAAACGLLAGLGTNWFATASSPAAENPYKISGEVTQICDMILAAAEEDKDPRPRCALPAPELYLYARLYAPQLELLWGRNVEGFYGIPDPEVQAVYDAWQGTPKDWDILFRYAQEHEYRFVCATANSGRAREAAAQYGYKRLGEVGDWAVYRLPPKKKPKKTG